MTDCHRREPVETVLDPLGGWLLRVPTQLLQKFTRMPSARRYALPNIAPVRHWVRRVRSPVPPLVAQPTGRGDVVRHIRAPITASIEMLGSALQTARLRACEAELISKGLNIRQPHGLTAVET